MSVAHRFGEPFLLPSLRTRYRALHLGNTANLGIFFDTAKRFFTVPLSSFSLFPLFFLYCQPLVDDKK